MSASRTHAVASLPRRERGIILAALLGITAVSWLYLSAQAGNMAAPSAMPGMPMAMAMPMPAPWGPWVFLLTLIMWWVMMLGMMLPSAAPMILMFATINRNKAARGQAFVPTSNFVLGYLLAWGGFSLAATLTQWAVERAALLSPMMALTNPALGAALLLLAGLYQFSPWKQACLHHCRSPVAFVLNHWRDGRAGALRMGLVHGIYCLGCCVVLMALLFVTGVMNLLWVALIAAFVFIEKLAPGGPWIARAAGAAFIALAALVLLV